MLAFQGRNADFRAQGGLGKRNRDNAMQVVSLPLEEGVLFHMQNNIEVARRAAVETSFAVSGETNARSILDSGWNFRVHRPLPQDATFPFALQARIGDYTARTLAGGTGARNTEEALLVAHLPPATTRTASHRRFARCRTRAPALFAGFMAAHRDLGLGAKAGFFEFQAHIFPQIGASLSTTAPPGAPTAKNVA